MGRLCATCVGLSAALLIGCVTGHYEEGNPIDWALVESIEPGVTTKAEVLARLGPPANYSSPSSLDEFAEDRGLDTEDYASFPFSDVFAYQVYQGRLRLRSVIFFSHLRLEIAADRVIVFFDEEDRVSHLGYRRGSERLE